MKGFRLGIVGRRGRVKFKCIMCELIFAFIKKLETSGNEYLTDRARLTGRRDIFEGLKVELIMIL